ncbi:ammonium transporter [Paracoccus liaowanqingii]|uniref:Ammonium transporter n=1 Tax=Paracoccus liaowanqingii TaxID=2560053 RepID=A0A4Z1CEV5_9RHOB|nr:ammonium transporter [Paracoccus liaowanqingii]TGN54306.1 ammonium transporter [Paracoccus liaowanqingii]
MNKTLPLIATLATLAAFPAAAQDAAAPVEAAVAVSADVAYIFNTLLFLIGGFLVMWMAAGFAMLEAGLVRSKNVTTQLFKNISLFAIAGIMYWLIGYNLMYPGDGWTVQGIVGQIFSPKGIDPVGAGTADDGYSAGSDFFFQLMFCATTASIVSGTLAERVKLWPFLIFTVVLTGLIYPIEASWQWGGGFLSEMGFSDFAGSTLVHAAGGFAALAGAIVLGARTGKYRPDGRQQPMPGSNLALATLGTFILWLGWFGFNGASQLAIGSVNDAADVSRIFVNTNMAASGGAVAAIIVTQLLYGKIDLTMVLNGALAGLVSITAEPLMPSVFAAILIGGVGGAIAVFVVPLLDKFQIDDVVGAIPVHLVAGIWGTMVVPLTNDGTSFVTQAIGVLCVGGFVFILSLIVWSILKATMGIRVSKEAEISGLDISEMGMEAYPDFVQAK